MRSTIAAIGLPLTTPVLQVETSGPARLRQDARRQVWQRRKAEKLALQQPAGGDDHRLVRSPGSVHRQLLDLVHDVVSLENSAKHNCESQHAASQARARKDHGGHNAVRRNLRENVLVPSLDAMDAWHPCGADGGRGTPCLPFSQGVSAVVMKNLWTTQQPV